MSLTKSHPLQYGQPGKLIMCVHYDKRSWMQIQYWFAHNRVKGQVSLHASTKIKQEVANKQIKCKKQKSSFDNMNNSRSEQWKQVKFQVRLLIQQMPAPLAVSHTVCGSDVLLCHPYVWHCTKFSNTSRTNWIYWFLVSTMCSDLCISKSSVMLLYCCLWLYCIK